MTTSTKSPVVNCGGVTHKTSNGPSHGMWGIDTVRLAFEVDTSKIDLNSKNWSKKLTGRGSSGEPDFVTYQDTVVVNGVDVQVFVYSNWSRCHLEFNASRFMHSDRLYLLPPALLREKIQGVLLELASKIQPRFIHIEDRTGEVTLLKGWDNAVKFSRLDIAENIECSDSEGMYNSLIQIPCRYGSELRVIKSNDGWSICHASKTQGQDKIYDKSAEMKVKGVQSISWQNGYLRFEAELRDERLEKHGLTTVRDFAADKARAALESRWQTSGFNRPIPKTEALIATTKHFKYEERVKVVGHAYLKNAGVPTGLSRRQQKRWDSKLMKITRNNELM